MREVIIHFRAERRMRQLCGQDRRDAERDRDRHRVAFGALQQGQEWQVGVEGRFRQPVAAVRPAAMVQHPGQVRVEREDEAHQPRLARARQSIAIS